MQLISCEGALVAQASSLHSSSACRRNPAEAFSGKRPKEQAGSLRSPERELHARAAAAVVSSVFHRLAFRFDLRQAGAAFHFHDLVAQQRGALELEIRRSTLHLVFQLAEQFREIEVSTGFVNDGGGDLPATQDRMQTFLDRAADRLWT